jgi:hypothetical protein
MKKHTVVAILGATGPFKPGKLQAQRHSVEMRTLYGNSCSQSILVNVSVEMAGAVSRNIHVHSPFELAQELMKDFFQGPWRVAAACLIRRTRSEITYV